MIKYVALAFLLVTGCHREPIGAMDASVDFYTPAGPSNPSGGPCGDVGEQCCVPIDPGALCNEGLYCDYASEICRAPDMSIPPDLMSPSDLSVLADMSVPVDMTVLYDFSTLPDLTIPLDMTVIPDMTCIPASYTPTIELLIDRSGSMTTTDCVVSAGTCPAGTTAGTCGTGKNAPAGCVNNLSRWALLKYALTDASVGVVSQLQSQVYFGATLFDVADGLCPDLISSGTPALNNAAAIQTLLATYQPSGNTPTAAAEQATATYVSGLAGAANTKFIVLATDGLPNTCSSQADDTTNTVAAITAAYSAGITTYVLGVGPDTSSANLQAMANAGQGMASGAVFYKGQTPTDLVTAFNAIISTARGCH